MEVKKHFTKVKTIRHNKEEEKKVKTKRREKKNPITSETKLAEGQREPPTCP